MKLRVIGLIFVEFHLIGERRHGGDGEVADSSDRLDCGIDGPAGGLEHGACLRDDEGEELEEEEKKKEVENKKLEDKEVEEELEEEEEKKVEEEKEEGHDKGIEKEEEEEGEDDEDELIDICVDDTQSAAPIILGDEDQHFPPSVSGRYSAVSGPTSDLVHKQTTLADGELERGFCNALHHTAELKDQESCVSNAPHAFLSPSPFAFPYTSDSLSATPMAAAGSPDTKDLIGAQNDKASAKRPDTQSSSTQYTQSGLLKCDSEGLSTARTRLVTAPVVVCEMPMTEKSVPGKAANALGAGSEAASSVSESIPIPQYSSSPAWATKGSETGGSYAGNTLTSSFGAGECQVTLRTASRSYGVCI